MERTMEAIFIENGEIDNLFMGSTPINLWRALKLDNFDGQIFNPVLKSYLKSNGGVREPDIKTYSHSNGKIYVKAIPRQGMSLMSRSGAFKGNWTYYLIPAGTEIPIGLVVSKDRYSPQYEFVHYTLSPNYDMPLENYLALLNQFAQNALAKKSNQPGGVLSYGYNK